ncbi:unnamed protein product (macronuclear) [Paramecium tetraurelia]|uniref:RING-type E3 ubiquitin transferase n=1 Tax=Paramecium tetraurelia TaxID=5888 RepID=A0C1C7_PARTE|nr:uncharacterized protein GSPATT00034070001 [Paramecium tetraurelia]CAK64594.1 unnamed protein product [Paramecium tetraurelia]|eukprot:XP_001431992.1 hypothetical protein (macronuclear) [Paramecium tetraurelia strain d4-2]
MQQVKQFAIRRPNVVQKPKAETIPLKPVGKVLQQIPLLHSQVPENNSILFTQEEFKKLQQENEQLRHQLNNKFQDYDKKIQIMNELVYKFEEQIKRRESDIHYYIHKIEYNIKEIKQQKEVIAKLRNKKKDYKMKFLALQQQNPQQQQDPFQSLVEMRELLLQFRLTAQVLPLLQQQWRLRQYQNQIIDVDNMNYEELLSLGEQIGNVSNGIAREDIRRIRKQVIQASDNIQGVCPVCQCNMEIGEKYRRLGCNHHYHAKCIKTWLLQHNNCPVCKQNVVIAI